MTILNFHSEAEDFSRFTCCSFVSFISSIFGWANVKQWTQNKLQLNVLVEGEWKKNLSESRIMNQGVAVKTRNELHSSTLLTLCKQRWTKNYAENCFPTQAALKTKNFSESHEKLRIICYICRGGSWKQFSWILWPCSALLANFLHQH